MKRGEETKVRMLLAKLSYEDQTYWRRNAKPLKECEAESSSIPISEEVTGKNTILVAEDDGELVGLCWCTTVDRGIDKQGEIAEFYVEREYRGKGVGKQLINAAKKLFSDEQVEVAFAWTHHGNKAATELYRNAGFKEVDQLVMALVRQPNRDRCTH